MELNKENLKKTLDQISKNDKLQEAKNSLQKFFNQIGESETIKDLKKGVVNITNGDTLKEFVSKAKSAIDKMEVEEKLQNIKEGAKEISDKIGDKFDDLAKNSKEIFNNASENGKEIGNKATSFFKKEKWGAMTDDAKEKAIGIKETIKDYTVRMYKGIFHKTLYLKNKISGIFEGSELRKRTVSGIILGTIALFAISNEFLFNIVILVISMLALQECFVMFFNTQSKHNLPANTISLSSLLYILVPSLSLIIIRSLPQGGRIVLWLILIVCTTDITSYFIGKKFGKNLLSPAISPGKTIEGAIGGIISAVLITMLFKLIFQKAGSGMSSFSLIFFTVVVSVLAIGGDLLESYMKRLCGVKDSGTILPGHGGILDRLDGFTLSAPFVCLLALVRLGHVF